jgi:hypothetical protein
LFGNGQIAMRRQQFPRNLQPPNLPDRPNCPTAEKSVKGHLGRFAP